MTYRARFRKDRTRRAIRRTKRGLRFECTVVFCVICVTADGISNVYRTIGAKKRNTPRDLFKISRPAVWRCHLIRGSSSSHSGDSSFHVHLAFSLPAVVPSRSPGSRKDRSPASCSDKSHVTIPYLLGREFVRKIDPFGNVTTIDARETRVSLGQVSS